MKNIHILPTDKPSRLACDFDKLILNSRLLSPILYKTQNIYIANDEEIKEGDWCIDDIEDVFKIEGLEYFKKFCKKIILTTDQDLIKDGIQSIDDEFLKWFVKNPSCKEVEIDKEQYHQFVGMKKIPLIPNYKIIISKEEPKQSIKDIILSETPESVKQKVREAANALVNKQETVEEFAERLCPNKQVEYDMIIEGAKWQQERSYSEEEVLDITKQAYAMGRSNYTIEAFNNWFKQFKKK